MRFFADIDIAGGGKPSQRYDALWGVMGGATELTLGARGSRYDAYSSPMQRQAIHAVTRRLRALH